MKEHQSVPQMYLGREWIHAQPATRCQSSTYLEPAVRIELTTASIWKVAASRGSLHSPQRNRGLQAHQALHAQAKTTGETVPKLFLCECRNVSRSTASETQAPQRMAGGVR